MILEKGKYYTCESVTGKYKILVTDIVSFKDADDYMLRFWKAYGGESTDYFIIAVSYEAVFPKIMVLVRGDDGVSWTGMGEYDSYDDTVNGYWCSGTVICGYEQDSEKNGEKNVNYYICYYKKNGKSRVSLFEYEGEFDYCDFHSIVGTAEISHVEKISKTQYGKMYRKLQC